MGNCKKYIITSLKLIVIISQKHDNTSVQTIIVIATPTSLLLAICPFFLESDFFFGVASSVLSSLAKINAIGAAGISLTKYSIIPCRLYIAVPIKLSIIGNIIKYVTNPKIFLIGIPKIIIGIVGTVLEINPRHTSVITIIMTTGTAIFTPSIK